MSAEGIRRVTRQYLGPGNAEKRVPLSAVLQMVGSALDGGRIDGEERAVLSSAVRDFQSRFEPGLRGRAAAKLLETTALTGVETPQKFYRTLTTEEEQGRFLYSVAVLGSGDALGFSAARQRRQELLVDEQNGVLERSVFRDGEWTTLPGAAWYTPDQPLPFGLSSDVEQRVRAVLGQRLAQASAERPTSGIRSVELTPLVRQGQLYGYWLESAMPAADGSGTYYASDVLALDGRLLTNVSGEFEPRGV